MGIPKVKCTFLPLAGKELRKKSNREPFSNNPDSIQTFATSSCSPPRAYVVS